MGDTKFRQTGRRTTQGPYRADEHLRKQQEAGTRNSAWSGLTVREKMASLLQRRGASLRQMKRLAEGTQA